MNKTFCISIVSIAAGFSLALCEPGDTLVYRYPSEVIITAPRMSMSLKDIPFSASVVTSEVNDNLPRAIAIDEPLKLVPGVKVDNQANGSRVHMSIRGQGILSERGIRGIRILLDQIPINDPTGFAPDVFDIDDNSIERMEVLRGPAASLYGGSASGGVVNVVTQNGGNRPLSAEASTSFGSNNFWKGFGQFGGNAFDANYRLSFSRTGGDGFRDHTHFWGNNVYGKITYTPTNALQITPLFSWTDFYHENPEGITLDQYRQNIKMANPDAIPFNEFLETNRTTVGFTGLAQVTEHNSIQFSGYTKRTLFTEANNRTFNHRTITTPGMSIQYTNRYGDESARVRNTISIGLDAQWQTIEEHRTDNLHSVEGDTVRSKEEIAQSGVGIFILDKIDVGPHWGVMGCLRFDGIENKLTDQLRAPFDLSGNADFSKSTARVGLDYSPFPEATFFANWGQGFLPPATEELAQNPDHFGGFNAHLTFATSEGFELGSRGLLGNSITYELTAFSMTTENDFDRYRITDPLRNQETFYRNVGSSKRMGVELYESYSPIASIRIQLAYTFADYQYTNSQPLRIMMDDTSIVKYIRNGNQLPNSPRHQFYADVEYTVVPGLTAALSAEGLSKSYIDGANIESEAADAYTLLHVRIRYNVNIGGLESEVSLSVRNLTDKEFIAFTEPDPGGNAYQPGARREVFFGLKFRL